MPNSHDQSGGSSANAGLSRREAAVRLGISVSSLRRLEDDLLLHPQMDDRGTYRFDPNEVAALEGRVPIQARGPRHVPAEERDVARAGRLAARVFRLFARNRSLPEIVIATKQPPERIRALYHEWLTGLEMGEMERPMR